MNDIDFIRKNPEIFNSAMRSRSLSFRAKDVLALDDQHRLLITKLQNLQKKRNDLTQEIALLKRQGKECADKVQESKETSLKIEQVNADIAKRDELSALMSIIPNIPIDKVPFGNDESGNVEIKRVGLPRVFQFTAQPHYELGEKLGLMDFKTATDISGARFVILKNQLARLERALANFMLDIHTLEFCYQEINHPALVNEKAMYGVGQLPKFADDSFLTTDNMRLIPTSEVVLTNLVTNRILSITDLPLRFTAYSQCFRSEAGSAGRDTRGMIRQHQFSKVELVSITLPEDSATELEKIKAVAEEVLMRLELPYRVMLLCTGDIGFSANMTYDLEVWMPAQNTYREISSCSNCGDFQARRMKARYRDDNKVINFVHTLNGSALAIGRTIAAIIENYQNVDGSITVPQALRKYMGGLEIISCQS